MRKIILTLIFCLTLSGSSFAQNNIQGMRILTVNALMEYGHRLYDRGDYNEATAVFNHVLTYDNHQPQALQYLKDMGHAPAVVPTPIASIVVPEPRVHGNFIPAPKIILVPKVGVPTIIGVDISDTESLKAAIEAKKRSIEKLKSQITQMRENMASQNAN